jgi:hypothetical protein
MNAIDENKSGTGKVPLLFVRGVHSVYYLPLKVQPMTGLFQLFLQFSFARQI